MLYEVRHLLQLSMAAVALTLEIELCKLNNFKLLSMQYMVKPSVVAAELQH